MRIGIDARELCGRATGVGRYLAGLLSEWQGSERARRHEFVLYAPQPIGMPLDTRRFATREVAGSGGTVWEQLTLPRVAARDHLDVWFAPAYSAPLLLNMPIVVAIHDLSFAAHPEWFTWRDGAKRRLIVEHSARRARAIVTISEFSKRELIERFAIAPDKVRVIAPGITHPTPRTEHRAANVLFTGSIFNRRHLPDLIRAFAPIARAHPDARLDIAGDNRTYPAEDLMGVVAAEQLDGRVRFHRYVSEELLAQLYAAAGAFAFLSEYEGLGLTPLEALAAGVPPVLLDTPVARESCGAAALYTSLNSRSITEALERALFAEQTRADILAAAPAVLARYQWSHAARETLSLLESQHT
jgi:glycosyltransferase involved in cell wall biosynthesis